MPAFNERTDSQGFTMNQLILKQGALHSETKSASQSCLRNPRIWEKIRLNSGSENLFQIYLIIRLSDLLRLETFWASMVMIDCK